MKATIIGGGITGLTTAVGLQQAGVEFALYEAAEQFKPAGAGLILSPNALYVYEQWGLYDQLQAVGSPLRRFDITDAQGRLIQKNDTHFVLHGKRYCSLGIHRSDLQQLLLAHLNARKLHLAQPLATIESASCTLGFQSGEAITADFVLACDGIHSVVRQALFPASRLRYSGQTCWRGVAQLGLTADQMAHPVEMWGNGLRFGYVPLGHDRVYWYGTAVSPPYLTDSNQQTLRTQYRHFAPIVDDLITSTATIMRHDLFDLQSLPTWWRGNTLLLGDAAHAMTPNMGQGAAQGIEDAWAIVNLLQRHDSPQAAFAAFEQARFAKANEVAKLSWQIGQVTNWQNGLACRLRNGFMRLVPTAVFAKQRARLFTVS